jgi:Subtilisin-like serine proteases
MKTITEHKVTILSAICLMLLLFSSCVRDTLFEDKGEGSIKTKAFSDAPFFYYGYEDKVIYLEQIMDKIFIRFSPDTDKEQILALIDGAVSLKLIDGAYWDKGPLRYAALESPDGKLIPQETIELFKERTEIVSATYMYRYNNGNLEGIMDEFTVLLKENTSYEQLAKLAKENGCKIGDENQFVKNQFTLHVPKTSELNAMQMANKFYETKLFKFSESEFVVLNAAQSNDLLFYDQWGLKNTGQSGGTTGIDINAEQAWSITTGSSSIKIAIIDNGVSLTHEDLQANLLAGYDATGNGSWGGSSSTDTHGTMVAGVVGAIQNSKGY